MKKQLDKLKSKIKTNKRFTIFLFVLLLVGITLGSFFVTMLSSSDKALIKEYLEQYMNTVKIGKLPYVSNFFSSFFSHLLMSSFLWGLGISAVGIPIILFLFFCKAFTIGFSIGSLIMTYEWKGILLSLVYVFPHQLLALFAYGILVIYALSISIKIIEAVCKKKTIDFRAIMGKYSIVLGFSLILLLLSSLYETFAMPYLMKFVLSI